jgi:hypothetical protein
MNNLVHLKEKAIKLRQQGYSLPEICSMLNRGKSTVHYWIKDIPLKNKIARAKNVGKQLNKRNNKGQTPIQVKFEKLHEKEVPIALQLWDEYSGINDFRLFVMAYLCEGYKRTKHTVQISNSNPEFMMFAKKWFDIINYRGKSIELTIQIHVDQNEQELRTFWGSLLHMENVKISRKTNSGKMRGRNWNSKYGVATIRLSDAYLKTRVDTWITKMFEELK